MRCTVCKLSIEPVTFSVSHQPFELFHCCERNAWRVDGQPTALTSVLNAVRDRYAGAARQGPRRRMAA